MVITCVIKDCVTQSEGSGKFRIPLFPLPKSKELQYKWFQNIDSSEVCEKLRAGGSICLVHFEDSFIHNNCITPSAIPTLKLNRGNTLVDYEELLRSAKDPPQPQKKKRGTSGLMNLQIARRKKMMRRERMQKLAEIRRIAKQESMSRKAKAAAAAKMNNDDETSNSGQSQKQQQQKKRQHEYDISRDFYLGERAETDNEKIVISLRLTNLMKHLHDGKTTFTKHPSSIRDAKLYPIFNKIRHVQELLTPENPVFWNRAQAQIFVEQVADQKGLLQRMELHEIDGESLLALTKADLEKFFELNSAAATNLSKACAQLKSETIMRFVNS